jgi:hypothetical protein
MIINLTQLSLKFEFYYVDTIQGSWGSFSETLQAGLRILWGSVPLLD